MTALTHQDLERHIYPFFSPPHMPEDATIYLDQMGRYLKDTVTDEYLRGCLQDRRYPVEVARGLADKGAFLLSVPEDWGGAGLTPYVNFANIFMIAEADPSLALHVSIQTSLVIDYLREFADEDLARELVAGLVTMELIGSFALTSQGSGSDSIKSALKCTKVDRGWMIEGESHWISNGGLADVVMVHPRCSDPQIGMQAFVITDFKAKVHSGEVQLSEPIDKSGLEISDTRVITWNGLFVPDEFRLGKSREIIKNAGFKSAMKKLDSGRGGIAAQAMGILCKLLGMAQNYITEREMFETYLGALAWVRESMVRGTISLNRSFLQLSELSRLMEADAPISDLASMLKYSATEESLQFGRQVQDMYAANGVQHSSLVPYLVNSLLITTYYEGASRLQLDKLAGSMFGRTSKPMFV